MRKISSKQIIFWLLLWNAKHNGNMWLSAGHFCERDVRIGDLGYFWLSYKGSTRISDTIYQELDETWIKRKAFKSKNGTEYYKYRIPNKKDVGERKQLPADYKYVLDKFKKNYEE